MASGAVSRDRASAIVFVTPGMCTHSEMSVSSSARSRASSAMIKDSPGAFAFMEDTANRVDNESDRSRIRTPPVCGRNARTATWTAMASQVVVPAASPMMSPNVLSSDALRESANHLSGP